MTRLSASDQTRIAALVREVAATEIMPRFQNLATGDIDQKAGPQDLVTAADLVAEEALTAGLRRLFPSALVVGEEAIAAQPDLRDRIDEAELCFVIDPVDGTWNYAHGVPLFGVILAATSYGVPVFGLLHDPVCDTWMMAATDAPACRVHADGRQDRLTTAPGTTLGRATGYMHFYLMPQTLQTALAPRLADFGKVSAIRCSCHEYRTLAQGAVEFCLSAKLNPWDHAAGVLICQQAGGHVAMLDGRPYSTHHREGFLLSACDMSTWQAVRDHIAPALKGA